VALPRGSSRIRFVRAKDTPDKSRTHSLASTKPESDSLTPPYRLNFDSIVRIVYAKDSTVRASREEMLAGKYALDEFRANLSRLEPYAETRSDVSDFPNRGPNQAGAFGNTLESVVGVKKETFGGAVLSTEVGASYSRYKYDQVTANGDSVESGAGALLRARLEMPFFGSRRLQDRIIAQAFQDSTARKAQLDYIRSFRAQVENAVSYYNQVVFWQRELESSEQWMAALDQLLGDPRLREADRPRIESSRAGVESSWNRVRARQIDNLGSLIAFLELNPDDEVAVEIPDYQLSSFVEQGRQDQGLRALIERARMNNPAFRILNDAIKNAQLQRDQAAHGRYDVTTFLEGTTFPLGSAVFDNRYQGWTIGGGINIRLTDRRARNATRLKSEAQIRQFEAQMDAEEIGIRQKIVSNTTSILSNDENRKQLLDQATRLASVFETRRNEYFAGMINIDQLLSARADIYSNEGSVNANLQHTAEREALLALAIGQVYEMVGLKLGSDATEGLTPSAGPAKAKPNPATQETK